MISLQELNPHGYATTAAQDIALATLLERINKIRLEWSKPMIVTSGLRSAADQARINPKAPHSHHLNGEAVDISDPDGSLQAWLKAAPEVLVDSQLWCEEGTSGWVHFQIVPPASGKRWFLP